jgi:hypothetical protein
VSITANQAGVPRTIGRERVAAVEETWRIDEGWWRSEPLSRRYWRLLMASGDWVTVYQDLLSEQWFGQRY